MRTADEFAAAAHERRITWWPVRPCSICGVSIGYEFHHGVVAFRSGCGCSSFDDWNPRTWEDVAGFYNMQDAPAVIARFDEFWGFTRSLPVQPETEAGDGGYLKMPPLLNPGGTP